MNADSYKLVFHPAVRKDLRRLPREASRYIVREVFPALATKPGSGVMLRGSLRHMRKYVARHGGASYRVVYQFDARRNSTVVLMVGPRSDFYDRLLRRVR